MQSLACNGLCTTGTCSKNTHTHTHACRCYNPSTFPLATDGGQSNNLLLHLHLQGAKGKDVTQLHHGSYGVVTAQQTAMPYLPTPQTEYTSWHLQPSAQTKAVVPTVADSTFPLTQVHGCMQTLTMHMHIWRLPSSPN